MDSTGIVGLNASMTIGADGLPFVSYFATTAKSLEVAHCSNAFCTQFIRRR